jgi:phosphoribosylaminoimidazole-succinocarboxamide synthase
MRDAIYQADIPELTLRHRGKVRDLYEVDEAHWLIVTSDRLSAFDVVLPQAIPGKGEVLTQVADFWFKRTEHLLPNHLTNIPVEQILTDPTTRQSLGNRAIVVKKLRPLPIEAIVRGYLIGSGWADYQSTGHVCGLKLPDNLRIADKLPEPLYTPSTKAAVGAHDENIDFAATIDLLGSDLATQIKQLSLQIYTESAAYARQRGIIIADTKFEFGLNENHQLHLIDEVLTPDSSRFWPVSQYRPGISPPSFDKQFVRDYLETLDWDKTPPGPELPLKIIQKTAEKYQEAKLRLTTPA